MKTTILLATAIAVTGGIWLRAQQSEPANMEASASGAIQSARGEATCAMKHNSQNSAHLLAWDQELNLTDEQRAGLRAIQDKAGADAKDLLTADQQEKLKELATPPSMMQCMHPMRHTAPSAGEIEHGVSASCSQAHGQAEEAHSRSEP
jgi:hypothetical protein